MQCCKQSFQVYSFFPGSIGIVQHLDSVLPFGSRDRVVFEGTCFSSCSPNQTEGVKYQWVLKKLPDTGYFREYDLHHDHYRHGNHPRSKDPEDSYDSSGGASSSVRDYKEKVSSIETKIFDEVETAYKEATTSKKRGFTYLARPRDYLKVNSRIKSQQLQSQEYTNISASENAFSDKKKRSKGISPKYSSALPSNKTPTKERRKEPSFGQYNRSEAPSISQEISVAQPLQQSPAPSSSAAMIDQSSSKFGGHREIERLNDDMNYIGLLLSSLYETLAMPQFEQEALELVQKMFGEAVSKALLARARLLYLRSLARRQGLLPHDAAAISRTKESRFNINGDDDFVQTYSSAALLQPKSPPPLGLREGEGVADDDSGEYCDFFVYCLLISINPTIEMCTPFSQ